MLYFNFNGKILKENTPVIGADNRGLRYGDGLFETLRYKNGTIILLDEHLSRLWKGLQLMNFELPKLLTPDRLQWEMLELVKKNNSHSARIRLSVLRGDGGLYDQPSLPAYIIQSWPMSNKEISLNENGLQLCTYTDAKKTIDKFSNIKHNNYLPYFMAAAFAKINQCNDAIVLNNYNRICDSTIANIFIIKNDIIYTPSLDEGCIAGIMRKCIIQLLAESGVNVEETRITEDTMMDAEEIFLTNSIFNIAWVAGIGSKKYGNIYIRKIYELLCQTNQAVFC